MVVGVQVVGTRVAKINSEPKDLHQDGALAKITGDLAVEVRRPDKIGVVYIVEWDDMPGVQVVIAGTRLRLVEGAE
jgi:hypothetical protein